MSSKPMTQTEMKRVKWHTIISEWEESGLKKNEFCKSRCLDPKQFCYYQKAILLNPAEAAKMLPIEVSPEPSSKGISIEPLTLYLSSKVKMTIPLPCDTQVLQSIFLAASGSSC
jgi:hypothetical protein